MPKSKRKAVKSSQLKKCKGCNVKFTPKDGRQKFHSVDCRVRYYQEHYGSLEVTKTCPNCGTSFPTTKPKKQTYCKPGCREEARQKRQDEVTARVKAEKRTYLGERFAALERDGFKCVYCGKSKEQGAVLDVIEDQEELKTICLECKIGREFLGREVVPHPQRK